MMKTNKILSRLEKISYDGLLFLKIRTMCTLEKNCALNERALMILNRDRKSIIKQGDGLMLNSNRIRPP